jgi:hypothetical protein
VILAVVLGAVALVLVVAGTAVGIWYVDRTTAPPARVVDGIPAPDLKCITDVQDVTNPWVTNGWWAGYADGKSKQMTSAQAQAMSVAGHDMRGVWLCPPRGGR